MQTTDFRIPEKSYTSSIFLSAGRCNAQGELPLTSLSQHLIDIATAHANLLDIGYDCLRRSNASWVLNHMLIEMTRYPKINQSYKITTWVVTTTRLYSDRAYAITDIDDNILGYALTRWVAIDIDARKPVNLIQIFDGKDPNTGVLPPIQGFKRLTPVEDAEIIIDYTFKYCDIDCNRHVNTTRYIEHILNLYSVDFFDSKMPAKLDIVFHHEAYFGDQVSILRAHGDTENEDKIEIRRGNIALTVATLKVEPRKKG